MLNEIVILDVLVEKIKKKEFEVIRYNTCDSQNEIFFNLMNDLAYKDIKRYFSGGITIDNCFIIIGKNEIYYVLGTIKRQGHDENQNGKEEIHLYYHKGIIFNVMLTKYIVGGEYQGEYDKEIALGNLLNVLNKY